MSNGKKYRLTSPVFAISSLGERRFAGDLPVGSIIEVISIAGENDKRLVDVRYEGREYVIFAGDLLARSEEIDAATTQ